MPDNSASRHYTKYSCCKKPTSTTKASQFLSITILRLNSNWQVNVWNVAVQHITTSQDSLFLSSHKTLRIQVGSVSLRNLQHMNFTLHAFSQSNVLRLLKMHCDGITKRHSKAL